MGRNIVVMCDGTWNNPNSQTNVFTLYKELIERDYEQHVLYIDGIGIGELAWNFIVDGAMALSLDNKIKEGYRFIVDHYHPDDDIWLFGFSRGAYTARCIAGMLRNCGILNREINPDQIDKSVDLAYGFYRDRDLAKHPEAKASEEFKKSFSYPDSKKPIIKFLGLWDTVGAHGLPGYVIGDGFRYLEFYDQTVPSIVKNACQALATHENNAFFGPCRILPNKSGTIVKETWFPGVHSEIGGGAFLSFKGNERITNATLLWMIENIVEVGGLLMHDDIETYRNRFSPDIGPSWNLMNYIFDHISSIFPAILVKDRTIPLELDSSQKFLRKDLLYRDGDWLLPFGVRSYIYTQYFSKTYEKLRKDMETKGIKLYDNKRYDMDISKKA
ncbi:hypothetical protein RhiirA5_367935 [Rhizophagus irregularis]|uniref:T6SS Phospholipase effector Tle1-like catalytic domain-containing protein n=1 Tax=Rhizophagus irregularis TaxID=588596 RepID=A0A2I1ESN2_9GLOM|nr:hypothetical protein RhiirA5_367940 [Rhizophagus irregularis]PKB95825.1 hypothetical protein RhiirA5_367935 [Rhizophagus irregularis]PKC60928.1 hypothetical protein RhiirA1_425386 [Rhizophagus irregularis]PKY25075.1 hypothetical protein RhiirB3_413703 [Rhizophagus irregularis]